MSLLPFDLPDQPAQALTAIVRAPSPHPAPELLYQSAWATVWCGSALDILPKMAKESVDLVVTDPPYGIEHQSNRRSDRFDQIANDTQDDRGVVAAILEQSVRLVGQHRHLYVFGPADVMAGLKVAEPVEMIWDKGAMGSGDVTAPWGSSHEPITFAVSKFRHAGETGAKTLPARIRKGTVLSFSRVAGRKLRHPHQKPVPLLRELIESSSRQGEVVLDGTAGSGSTGVASILCGRRTILIELDRGHAQTCVERVQAAEKLAAQIAEA